MALHWILLFIAVILIGLIAWHSSRFSVSSLKKVFERRGDDRSDSVLGLDATQTDSPESKSTQCASSPVLTLNIKAPDGEAFSGAALEPLLREAGMYFGDLNIFHYEVEHNGDYYSIFSLASAFEPGYFDMSTIYEYVTPGLTMFMEPDQLAAPRDSFDLMLTTAKNVSEKLGGILCDDKWTPLTVNTIEQYYARLGH